MGSVPHPTTFLPYKDKKAQGAPDFYFAINATFRFVREQRGMEGLIRYWSELGRAYLKPVHASWKDGGLTAIADYWRAFFAAEPGSNVEVEKGAATVTVQVRTCPAIAHLKQGGREILPEFCQHCYYVSEAAAKEAGYTVRVCGGAGTCTQTFHRRENAPPPQQLSAIRINPSSSEKGANANHETR